MNPPRPLRQPLAINDGEEEWLPGLHSLLVAIRDDTPDDARLAAEARANRSERPATDLALASIAAVHALRPEDSARLANTALQRVHPPTTGGTERELVFAALALAGAWGDGREETQTSLTPAPSTAAPPTSHPSTTLTGHFVRYQLAEGRLACGQVQEAVDLVDLGAGHLPREYVEEQSTSTARESAAILRTLGAIMRTRALLFNARVRDAAHAIDEIFWDLDHPNRVPGPLAPLVLATRMLVSARADDKTHAARLLTRILTESGGPISAVRSYRSSGQLLLIAYGLLAEGDLAKAARYVHLARACGPLLEVDNALSLETLLMLAATDEDEEAAEVWTRMLDPLATSRAAGPTVLRCRARLSLLRKETGTAEYCAELAAEAADAEGRLVESAEALLIATRARVAAHRPAVAASGLHRLLEISDDRGHLAARRAAAKEMRAAGRRLLPTKDSAWEGLSEREREVALLLAAGLTNAEIAATLFLSPHTVRAHVSRVLTAFSAASRLMVASRIAELMPLPTTPPPPLTRRQSEVADRVAHGLGNAAIAAELGITLKTVEKHLTEIHRRWGANTRTGVALLVRTRRLLAESAGPAE